MKHKKKKRKHAAPRKPRKRFHVQIVSNWQPNDWTGGTVATVSTAASLGPGKAVVDRILRDVIKQGIVRIVHELCEGALTVEEALAQLVELEGP